MVAMSTERKKEHDAAVEGYTNIKNVSTDPFLFFLRSPVNQSIEPYKFSKNANKKGTQSRVTL